jgi:hypothetical protein
MITGLVATFAQKEKEFIKAAEKAGYRNPLEHHKHKENIEWITAGKKYRKFIIGFTDRDYRQLKPDQTRDKVYDQEYCHKDLMPRITKEGLQYLPHINCDDQIQHGHNRCYSMEKLYPGQRIPVFIISPVYEEQTDGSYTEVTNERKESLRILSNFQTNPQPDSNPHTMNGVAVTIKKIFSKDVTMLGHNPSGEWEDFIGDNFNNFMDELCPGFFLDPGTRTQIRNKAGDEYSVVLPITFDDWTKAAANAGWTTGIKVGNKKPSRLSFEEWIDDNCYVGHVSTNGNKLKEKIFLPLADMFLEDETFGGKRGVKILLKIDRPSLDINQLNKQTVDFIETRIDILNRRLFNKGWIGIVEVVRVRQLNIPSDTGLHFVLDKKTNLLKKK